MKKVVVLCVLMIVCGLSSVSVVLAKDSDGKATEKEVSVVEFSSRAKELIQQYGTLMSPPPGMPRPRVLRPRPLSDEHLVQGYRSAWEELLLNAVSESPRPGAFWDRIIEALWRTADPRSVTALEEAFKRTTRKHMDQDKAIHRQKDILLVLVTICDESALMAILSSLDLADEVYSGEEQATTADGLTLRGKVYQLMLAPDNPGKSDAQKKGIEKAKKWKSLLNGHDRTKLSKKNREFLDKAKSFKRTNKGEDE